MAVMEAQQLLEGVGQLGPGHDQVDLALLHQELGGLEPLGELLADGLLDHLGAGEPDLHLGLADDEVAERREGGAHPAVGGVRQQREIGDACLGEEGQRGRGLGHLHE